MNHSKDQDAIFTENVDEYRNHWTSLCNEARHVQNNWYVVLEQLHLE